MTTISAQVSLVGHVTGVNGERAAIYTDHDGVRIDFGGRELMLGPAERNEFIRTYVRADFMAEANEGRPCDGPCCAGKHEAGA